MGKFFTFTVAGLIAGFMLVARADAQMMPGSTPDQSGQSGMMGCTMGQGMAGGMMGQGMHKGCMMGGMTGQGMMGSGMMGAGMRRGFGFYLNLAGQIDLAGAQIEKLRSMKFEFDKANVQRKAALQTARIELQQLKAQDNADVKKVEVAIRDVHAKQAELEIAVFQAQTEAQKVLTAEQRAKLKTLTCPICGGMHSGMMGGGTMPGGMMQQETPGGSPSPHEQHH